MRPTAYSYIRFSTPEQAKGDSFRRQFELSRQYAEKHGLILDKELTFHDSGVSAFDQSNLGKDGQLRKFLNAIDSGRVAPGSFLLVESLDRISRAQILDAFEVFLGILNRGITLVTMADGWVYNREQANSNPMNLVVSLTILSRAHEESLTKSRRLKAVWESKREGLDERKLTKICPAWLQLNDSETEYQIVEEKAAVVRQIVDLVMSGVGRHAIVKRLNEAKIPSIGRRGARKIWFESYIVKILRNRALIGEFQPHKLVNGKREPAGQPRREYFPRLLQDEEFGLLQQLITERGSRSGGQRGTNFSNLFTGLLRCGYCRGTMVYVNKGNDRRTGRVVDTNRFVVCANAKRGAGCRHIPWVYSDLESVVLKFARGLEFGKFVKEGADRNVLIESLRASRAAEETRLAGVREGHSRLISSIEKIETPPLGIINRIQQCELEMTAIQERIDQIDHEMRPAKNQAELADVAMAGLDTLMAKMNAAEGDELYLLRARLNEHFRRLVDRITLYPGGIFRSQEDIHELKRELMATGDYTQAQVDSWVDFSNSVEPRREDRCLVIANRSGLPQVVQPGNVYPDIVTAMRERRDEVRQWASGVQEISFDKQTND